MNKVKLHSVVDIITNSSTVIYTDYSGCVSAVRELITEMFKMFGVNESVDDVFMISVRPEMDRLIEYISDNIDDIAETALENEEVLPPDINGLGWSEKYRVISNACEEMESQPTPNWYSRACEYFNDRSGNNELMIIVKDQKYQKLADLIIKTIDAADHDSEYDG